MKAKPPSRRKATHLQNAVCPHPLLLPCTPYSSCPDRPIKPPVFALQPEGAMEMRLRACATMGLSRKVKAAYMVPKTLRWISGLKEGTDICARTHTHAYTHLDAKGLG